MIIKGYNNHVIIWEKGFSKELTAQDNVKGFSEIRIEGNDNILELEFPINAQNSTIHIIGNSSFCKICSTFKFLNNFIYMFEGNNQLFIDKNTSIRDTRIGLGVDSQVRIGFECMIAEANIRGTDFHTIIDITNSEIINRPKRVLSIGNKCWIGEGCRILKNAIIPDNCIIGAGSVVAKEFNDTNCIIAGNPAKVIKEKIAWDRNIISEYTKNGPYKY